MSDCDHKIQKLVKEANEISELGEKAAEEFNASSKDRLTQELETKYKKWLFEIHNTKSTDDLVKVTARLSSERKKPTRNLKALREAVVSEIECQNAKRITDTMTKLDASATSLTTKLTYASWTIAIVGLILSGVQIWHGFQTSPIPKNDQSLHSERIRNFVLGSCCQFVDPLYSYESLRNSIRRLRVGSNHG